MKYTWNYHSIVNKLFVVQSLSCVQHLWPHGLQHAVSLSFTILWSLLKFMSTESVIVSNHLILCHPLLLPSIFSRIRIFSSESTLHIKWPEYWSFSFRISPSNEYSGLISLTVDWLDLLVVQGTLKSSPAPQFKGINYSTFSLLHDPTLTSVHDYWKNRSFAYTDICQQSDGFAFIVINYTSI